MNYDAETTCTAFLGARCLAAGALAEVAPRVKRVIGHDANAPVLILDDATGRPIEVDFRGTVSDVVARVTPAPRGRGRPRLGVVPREVTLLPRHWEWLARQPGGASVALRRLIDEARKSSVDRDAVRAAQEAAYRFMLALAGNEAGYQDAVRALYAGDRDGFEGAMRSWPDDVKTHALRIAEPAFPNGAE